MFKHAFKILRKNELQRAIQRCKVGHLRRTQSQNTDFIAKVTLGT